MVVCYGFANARICQASVEFRPARPHRDGSILAHEHHATSHQTVKSVTDQLELLPCLVAGLAPVATGLAYAGTPGDGAAKITESPAQGDTQGCI